MSSTDRPSRRSTTHDQPAWAYLALGGVLVAISVGLLLAGAAEDSRRPLAPWLLGAGGLLACGYGVREWVRNGSFTARRAKSAEEQERDARSHRRMMRWQAARVVVSLVVLGVIIVAVLLQR